MLYRERQHKGIVAEGAGFSSELIGWIEMALKGEALRQPLRCASGLYTVLALTGGRSVHAEGVLIDESQVFVSSANFTEAAQEENVEPGWLLCPAESRAGLSGFFDSLAKGLEGLERLI